MAIGYTQILLLCFSALIIHWTNTATLHSSLHSSTKKLLRRQSPASAPRDDGMVTSVMQRSKRWTKARDHDEIEIPTNETNLTESIATEEEFPVDPTSNTTLSMLSTSQQSDHSTNSFSVLEVSSFESQATISNDSDTDYNGNFSSTFFTDLNETLSFQPSFDTSRTNEDVSSDPPVSRILFNLTTISYSIPGENPTDEDEHVINATDESILALKDAFLADHETDNLTQTNDLVLKTIDVESVPSPKVICDQSCQCSKACPYGFEIFNETCECNPPCQNYQCFGNDTCIVTETGQPRCQPANGTEHDRPSRCYQPRDAGFHDYSMGYHSRWYYHPGQDTCHLFVYRGLGGNENNFRTLHECHLECITCAPPPDRGTCFGRIQMWHYDHRTRACAPFEYSGCRGNENKFVREEQCLDTCANRVLLSH